MNQIQVKDDKRLALAGWAPGNYMNKCCHCGEMFIGDKRAQSCADCAYDNTPCNGQVFRVVVRRYVGAAGDINECVRLRPLHRLSCPGCKACGWFADAIKECTESGNIDTTGLVNGDICMADAVCTPDRETGNGEFEGIRFVRIEPDTVSPDNRE